jgi:hypothetical protein
LALLDAFFTGVVDSRPISEEEKFGYLLESVVPKVRDIISNLKLSSVGYKTAWDRLKKEYGQTRAVISAHLDEIINLPILLEELIMRKFKSFMIN